MKTGSTLQQLAIELERQQTTKRDFVSPTTELEMRIDEGIAEAHEKGIHLVDGSGLRINGHGTFPINDTAHEQIASRVGIPQKYYDRMKVGAPQLMAANVNHWFKHEKEKRMVRTLDGNVRGFLSEKYRPLDGLDLAQVTLPILSRAGVRVESSELTPRRLYIKAVTERITAEIRKGDVVQAGIVISNSEIGMGAVKIEPMVFRLVCTNGMIASDHSMRKYHVGRSGSEGDFASEFFADETRKADDKAFWMKVRDVVSGSFKQDIFNAIVNNMRAATERIIDVDVVGVVEVVRKQYGLGEGEKSDVLTHLIKGGDLTQYGLLNAVTRASADVESYDRATELERMGGDILAMGKTEWETFMEGADKARHN